MAMMHIPAEQWEALLAVVRDHKQAIENLNQTVKGLVQAQKDMREAHNMCVESFNEDLETLSEEIGLIAGYVGLELVDELPPIVDDPDCSEKEEAANVIPITKKVLH